MRGPKPANERRITLLGMLRGLAGLAGRIGEGRIYPSVHDGCNRTWRGRTVLEAVVWRFVAASSLLLVGLLSYAWLIGVVFLAVGFIKRVSEKVTEGTSALFALTSEAKLYEVIDELKHYDDFEIISTDMTAEKEKRLREAFPKG